MSVYTTDSAYEVANTLVDRADHKVFNMRAFHEVENISNVFLLAQSIDIGVMNS